MVVVMEAVHCFAVLLGYLCGICIPRGSITMVMHSWDM